MESRFSHLRQRDTSVSMLRVKMSRRRSQSQKENRDRAVNSRRQLDKVPELDVSSMDASIAMANMSIIPEATLNKTKIAKNAAVEERLKQLERWKERKALEKEKEKREKERKGVFKTGLYHHKDKFPIATLPAVPAASTRAKEVKVNTAPSQSTRVTRSMKQQQGVQGPLKLQDPNASRREKSNPTRAAPVKPAPAKSKANVCAVEPVVRATRSANRPPVTAAPEVKDKPKDKPADVRSTRSRAVVNRVVQTADRKKNSKDAAAVFNVVPPAEPEGSESQHSEEKLHPPTLTPHAEEEEEEEDMVVDKAEVDTVPNVKPTEEAFSFAPKGFVFQAPNGLSSFKLEPLTPRSADAFLTPSSSFNFSGPSSFNEELQTETTEASPPKSPRRSLTQTSPTVNSPTPDCPLEAKHDVPYFRSEISNETNRLTALCELWEPKVEDESIPEEMRDGIRTFVGQARLLMKERFKQFSGLVDNCEFSRGEKITTCSDLQGFWDMVYYQVEDVNKKFDSLKEAESRGWVEEQKIAPRQRKVVKKPTAAPSKPAGTKAAAKSRLAAAKAAMKAKQQAAEAEKAAKDAGNNDDNLMPKLEEGAKAAETVVFDGGFFQVESPAKPPGSMRRSSRLIAAVAPQASPCTNYLSPRRVTRRSLALAQTPNHTTASPAKPAHTPAQFCLTLDQTPAQAPKSQRGTPKSTQTRKDPVNVSLCFTPLREDSSDAIKPEASPAHQPETVVSQESTATPLPSIPTISITEEQDEAVRDDFALSLCETPLPVSKAPEPPCSLSFTISPCGAPSPPPNSSPAAVEAQESVCHSADSSVLEENQELDFERYFQPTPQCSTSPGEVVSSETMSPMAVDVEMESPRGQSEDLMTQQEPALPPVPSLLTLPSPQTQSAESELLLFTPNMKDRIRESVCPSDLMVFTPPL